MRLTWPRIVALASALSLVLASAGEWLLIPKDRLDLTSRIVRLSADSCAVVLSQSQHDTQGRLQLEIEFEAVPSAVALSARVGRARALHAEILSEPSAVLKLSISAAAPTDSGRVSFRWPSDDSIHVGLGRLDASPIAVTDWWWFSGDDRSNDSAVYEGWRLRVRGLQAACWIVGLIAVLLSADKQENVRRRRLEALFNELVEEALPASRSSNPPTPSSVEKLRTFLRLLVLEGELPVDALEKVAPSTLQERSWLVAQGKSIKVTLQTRFGSESLKPVHLLDRLTQ